MKRILNNIFLVIFLFFLFGLFFSWLGSSNLFAPVKTISLNEVVQKIKNSQVEEIVLKGEKITLKTKEGEELVSYKEASQGLLETLKEFGLTNEDLKGVKLNVKSEAGSNFWLGIVLSSLLPLLLLLLFFWWTFKQAQKGAGQALTFGRSRLKVFKPEKGRITFDDVADLKEAKEELEEVVEFLKNPQKFLNIGARIPKGVLLVGPPGCGKTLLARAVAGTAGVPFFHISGSEFIELFVGVGASRVRDAFSIAKKNAPSILFVDEIDAIGRERGAGLGGGHDEREQTLNQILVEMDGFEKHDKVVVIAATNRPDILDPALLRPGRFDRRVVLDLPDLKGREEILKIHTRKMPLANDVNLKRVAERTPGLSGADLENLVNEAAILAARKNKKVVSQQEFLDSIEKVILGPERKSYLLIPEEKKIAAYHEAGHALVSAFIPSAEKVQKISIIARGQAAGYTLRLPEEDRHFKTKSQFLGDMAVLLGGYLAEKIVFGDITTGASDDLKKATDIARALVTKYGMSEKIGPLNLAGGEEAVFLGREIVTAKDYSEELANEVDEEVRKFIHKAYKKAEAILKKKRKILDKLAETLLEKEIIEKEEFEKIIREG